jgi:type I restriction enzyme S subunit
MEKLLTEGIGHTEFKDTKIGRIPKGWDVVNLGGLCELINGHGFKQTEWSTKGLPIIRIQNLNDSTTFNYYDKKPEVKWIVEPGTLLFAWAGVKGVSFGPRIWTGKKGLLNQHIFKVIPLETIDSKWFFQLLVLITKKIEARGHGFKKSLLHVKKGDIVNQLIPFPKTLVEQKKIASILTTVDDKLEVLTSRKSEYQTLKKGLSQQLLTGQMRVKV